MFTWPARFSVCQRAGRGRRLQVPESSAGPAAGPGAARGARAVLARERRDPRRGRHGSFRGPAAHEQALYYQVLNFAMIVSSALMIWKGLIVVTGSESPIVVVLSGSMEPAFHRGDLLFLTNFHDDPIRAGEIVVFKVEGRDIPIVHRVIKVHEKGNGNIKFLTKGDNNEVDDRGLYKEGQNWLEKKDVVGRARGFLPYVGMVTIIMNDYPKFKYALLAVMGAYVLLKRES
ncbi:signal peptidase complex catalytic subunit SEC11C isoform X2 [Chamaea fasciata]|uniref:signal peptidase complex catalytic subunit SEC11C isoform X2 n=1 Tax=Chamaea fasciata TaxID=190680 RepID=UPI00336A52C9